MAATTTTFNLINLMRYFENGMTYLQQIIWLWLSQIRNFYVLALLKIYFWKVKYGGRPSCWISGKLGLYIRNSEMFDFHTLQRRPYYSHSTIALELSRIYFIRIQDASQISLSAIDIGLAYRYYGLITGWRISGTSRCLIACLLKLSVNLGRCVKGRGRQ